MGAARYRLSGSRRRRQNAGAHGGLYRRFRDAAAGLGGIPGRAIGTVSKWRPSAGTRTPITTATSTSSATAASGSRSPPAHRGSSTRLRSCSRRRPTRARPAHPRPRSWRCQTSTSRSSCRAGSACPTSLAMRRGSASATSRPAGSVSRRSSTSSTVTSSGWPAPRTRGPRRSTPTAPVRASAATSPTWRSRSAAR